MRNLTARFPDPSRSLGQCGAPRNGIEVPRVDGYSDFKIAVMYWSLPFT